MEFPIWISLHTIMGCAALQYTAGNSLDKSQSTPMSRSDICVKFSPAFALGHYMQLTHARACVTCPSELWNPHSNVGEAFTETGSGKTRFVYVLKIGVYRSHGSCCCFGLALGLRTFLTKALLISFTSQQRLSLSRVHLESTR